MTKTLKISTLSLLATLSFTSFATAVDDAWVNINNINISDQKVHNGHIGKMKVVFKGAQNTPDKTILVPSVHDKLELQAIAPGWYSSIELRVNLRWPPDGSLHEWDYCYFNDQKPLYIPAGSQNDALGITVSMEENYHVTCAITTPHLSGKTPASKRK